MFRETLLESSPARRKSKRWPMATAFTVELVVGAFLVVLPLLYSGVIPVSAQPPLYTPISSVQVASHPPKDRPVGSSEIHVGSRPAVVAMNNFHSAISFGPARPASDDPESQPPSYVPDGTDQSATRICIACAPPSKPKLERVVVSHLSEALLINKVEPIYPKFAIAAGLRGEVRLHAIIAKDGSIQTISVITGHPLLATAAVDAVRQWRYRPYVLNKEPVEVETFITVNFRGVRD